MGAGFTGLNAEPGGAITFNGLKYPPLKSACGSVTAMYVSLTPETVAGYGDAIDPFTLPLPVKSAMNSSSVMVTLTLTYTGSSVNPSSSR